MKRLRSISALDIVLWALIIAIVLVLIWIAKSTDWQAKWAEWNTEPGRYRIGLTVLAACGLYMLASISDTLKRIADALEKRNRLEWRKQEGL